MFFISASDLGWTCNAQPTSGTPAKNALVLHSFWWLVTSRDDTRHVTWHHVTSRGVTSRHVFLSVSRDVTWHLALHCHRPRRVTGGLTPLNIPNNTYFDFDNRAGTHNVPPVLRAIGALLGALSNARRSGFWSSALRSFALPWAVCRRGRSPCLSPRI
mgnify:CR=1 FL=1